MRGQLESRDQIEVRRILLARYEAQLSVKGLELGATARQPSADKSGA